jgi:hypothetical protein
MKKFILLCTIFLFVAGCISLPTPIPKSADLDLTTKELQQVEKDKNLTEPQKIIIKHAIAQLQNAKKTEQENHKLTNKVIKDEKAAGVGKFMYWIIGLAIAVVVLLIVAKIKGFIPSILSIFKK